MHGYNFERFANAGELQNTTQYVVKQGDNLYSIAKTNDVTVDELMNLNKMSSNMIYPNQILFIPKKSNYQNNQSIYKNEYITKKGDTLESIMMKNGITPDELDKYTSIYKLELEPNQIVELEGITQKKTYEVKSNDSVNSILNKHNITPMMLLEHNKENWLKPGTKIIVG